MMDGQPFDAEAIGKVYAKAMRLCSQREKCEYDMELWFAGKGVPREFIPVLVARLVEQRFIDNARYAEAYARDKMRLAGWGPIKIAAMLRAKRIDDPLIKYALAQAEDELGGNDLDALLAKKLQGAWRCHIGTPSLRERLLRFAVGRGFSFEDSLRAVDRVLCRLREGDL